MRMPVTIYDVRTSPSAQQDGVVPRVGPFDFQGRRPGLDLTMEFVGDSATTALYNMVPGVLGRDDCFGHHITWLDSNIEEGWPFFLAQSLGIACPVVVAVSGVGVYASTHLESLSQYYPRVLCCRPNPPNIAPHNDPCADEAGPSCIMVLVGGNDLLMMPWDPPSAQRAFLEDFISAYQALLRSIRHHRPCSPIVSLYGDAESWIGSESLVEREWLSSTLQRAVIRSVAELGGAPYGFFSCMVQSGIQQERESDRAYDMHWGANAHRKFAVGAEKAFRALVLSEEGQCFPAMASLAAKLQQTAADQVSRRPITTVAPPEALPTEQPQGVIPPRSNVDHTGGMKQAGADSKNQLVPSMESEDPPMSNLRAPADSSQALHDAAWLDNRNLVLELLENQAPQLRCGPLHVAAHAGHQSVVAALLQSPEFAPSVNVLAAGPGMALPLSALHLAAFEGHASVTECLLRSEVFSDEMVNSATDYGLTALHLACSAGKEEVVQMLLNEERFTAVNSIARIPDRGVPRGKFCTALDFAIGGHERVACLLLQHGRFQVADATALPRGPELPHHCPCNAVEFMADRGMVEGLQAYLVWHARTKPSVTLQPGTLWQAARAGHARIVQTLAEHLCVDTAEELEHQRPCPLALCLGYNALHVACFRGHLSVVQSILALGDGYGATINAKSSGRNPFTALHFALFMHHEEVASCLLSSKSFTAVNAVDFLGQTALHIACGQELEEISVEIIRHPCFIQHRHVCSLGNTASMVAKEKELRLVMDALAAFR
eukprot:CAMPEP_0178423414 /NCGR_PEP_ID=MMETSP0689_2-20121128/27677_1 /TAXON_ID=160604 /ORGANISM="Amphidinium massartii, Strain CS-259" /LENGTH=774 /DNA_ID=CAMNT_0020045009 /DNA_START=362 /DNA_END=2686 /DNA_ORIENTATION=-